eukprot:jgi/Ulvmu1/3206/UM015_0247.1
MKIPEQRRANVLKQIDFYFSDSNLPFDKFLRAECQAEGGWVDLSVVIAFARVQSLLEKDWKGPDEVTDDAIQLVSGIMQDSDIVEISDDQYQIRRKDMPSDWTAVVAAVSARTLHVAVLPHDVTIEKLGIYFSQHGNVRQVRLLKYDMDKERSGQFRGSALIEMSSQEEATALISANLDYEGAILRVQCKADYEEAVRKARQEKKDIHTADVWRPVLTVEGLPPDPHAEGGGDDAGDKHNATEEGEGTAGQNDNLSNGGEMEGKCHTQQLTVPQAQPVVVQENDKGTLVRFELVGTDEGLPNARDLRDQFGGQTKGIRFVDLPQGTTTGVIRCKEAERAEGLVKECSEGGELQTSSGHKFKLSLITGDEEVDAFSTIYAAAAARSNKRPRGGHAGRGGRGRHAKRGRR